MRRLASITDIRERRVVARLPGQRLGQASVIELDGGAQVLALADDTARPAMNSGARRRQNREMDRGEPVQARIQARAHELTASGREVGVPVAVIARGRLIVEVTSATADPATADARGQRPAVLRGAVGMVAAKGSAAYADIDSGVAVAVIRRRFAPATPRRSRASEGNVVDEVG